MIGSEQAIATLEHLRRAAAHAGYRSQIERALADAARRAGITPSQLEERFVPGAGLDSGGARRLDLARGAAARIRVSDKWKTVTEWANGDRWSVRPPAGVDPAQHPVVRSAAKELREAIKGERARLESLLAGNREWDAAQWREYYLDHPVTGTFARSLLWTVTGSGGSVTGLPRADGTLTTLEGERAVPEGTRVRLWHPARASTEEVRAWRERLIRDQTAQPFKQAFREVYLLTPAERETRTYSNRFAAHILHYQQTYALMKTRAWKANYLGPYDGGFEGRARREFPDAGLTAIFDHYPVHAAQSQVDLCSTDRVTFCRSGDRHREPIPLEDVPDLVFSEAMRDVDLFIGVASIGADPDWADRGDDPHAGYWREFSFGELSETARVRRDALTWITPRLKIASRLEVGERFLRVQGQRNAYKIHIGSGNIQVEPDDRYLCVVPASRASSKVMLPFDDDPVLSVILSKAMMLAADSSIKDETILRQLGSRG